jgi:iron complex transport system ATP-binding protein
MTAPANGLQARGLHFCYGSRRVLQGVDLALQPGEVVSLLGANGAGKSTLMRVLMGFMAPQQGRILLDGQPAAGFTRRQLARRIAYVPQVHVTPFPYTVRDIALLGRLPHTGLSRDPGPADRAAVDAVLARLGIQLLADRPYTEVSGGERQLTLIARALAQGARILVLDEPVSGLDYGNQVRLLALLRTLAAEGHAVLKTTHHPEHALAGSDRVLLLEAGRISADGPPAQVLTPDTLRTLYGVDVQVLHAADGRAAGFCAA